jgi:uncharacterized membrane protein
VRDGQSGIDDTEKMKPVRVVRSAFMTVALVISLAIIALAVASPPWDVLDKAHWVGYGICHQIAERTFFLNGQPLPLCARCSGTYLGAVLGFLGLVVAGRRRVGELPRLRMIVVLGAFVAIMGFDGVNSYLSFFPSAPHLYTPTNFLRVSTGLLNGLALSLIVYPVFNYTLWRHAERRESIQHLWELLPFFVPMALIVWGLEAGVGALLYPFAIISTGGVLALLSMVNTMIVLILLRREAAADNWRQAFPLLSMGIALSVLELSVMIAARLILTRTVGLPF